MSNKRNTLHAFITDDGYTDTAFIEGNDGVYNPCRIKYRPATNTVRAEMRTAMEEAQQRSRALESAAIEMRAVAKSLVAWEFLDDDGRVFDGVPEPTYESLLKIKPMLYQRIAGITVYGIDGGDYDPNDYEAFNANDTSTTEPPTKKPTVEEKQKN